MTDVLVLLILGVLGGAAVGLQSSIAGTMGMRVGGAATSLIVHAGGALASLVLLVVQGGDAARGWRALPWYAWASGALGLVLYLTLSRTVPRLGAASALALVVVGQLLVGLAVDHAGLFGAVRPVTVSRMAAAGLLLAGAYLMAR